MSSISQTDLIKIDCFFRVRYDPIIAKKYKIYKPTSIIGRLFVTISELLSGCCRPEFHKKKFIRQFTKTIQIRMKTSTRFVSIEKSNRLIENNENPISFDVKFSGART